MSSILRPYQQEGKDAIFDAWKSGHKNVMYQLVTGGGKTVLFVDIIKRWLMKGKRVNLIAHREELISQAWNTLYKNQVYAGIIKADVKAQFNLPCQVSSIQTIMRRKELPHADLIIVDEAHHALEDNSYGKVLAAHYPDAYVLFVTATPYRLGGKGFTNIAEILIQGPRFTDLVNWGYLAPLKYYAASIPDLSKAKLQGGDYNQDDAEEAMKLAPLVESYGEHCRGMCGVVFGVNVHHSRNIVDQYNASGVRAAHLDANTPGAERINILKMFRERRLDIISNVGIITEGFDFPDMEFVQLARPTKSLSLFLQMVGRVTRTDYNAIKDATSNEHRAQCVAQSKKPFGYVLDNAGLWKEHGLPDQEFNWLSYFNGYSKKKKEVQEFIEVIEFVAETPDGRQVRTELPQEVEGLKLIEVTKTVKQKILSIASLKEFERLTSMFQRMPKIQKKGFAVYQNFRSHCRKNNIAVSPEIWEYMERKLVTEPEESQSKILSECDNAIAIVQEQYKDNPDEANYLIKTLKDEAKRKTDNIKTYSVPNGYLRKERRAYETQEKVSAQLKELHPALQK